MAPVLPVVSFLYLLEAIVCSECAFADLCSAGSFSALVFGGIHINFGGHFLFYLFFSVFLLLSLAVLSCAGVLQSLSIVRKLDFTSFALVLSHRRLCKISSSHGNVGMQVSGRTTMSLLYHNYTVLCRSLELYSDRSLHNINSACTVKSP